MEAPLFRPFHVYPSGVILNVGNADRASLLKNFSGHPLTRREGLLANHRPGDFSAGCAEFELVGRLIQKENPYMVGADKIFGGLREAGEHFGEVEIFRNFLIQFIQCGEP